MTVIENDNPRVQYQGPFEINDQLPLTFPYTERDHVKCKIGDNAAEYGRDYSLQGSTVTLLVNVDKDTAVTIYRKTPIDQQAEFPQNQKFDSEKMNEALDKICMQQQEQEEILNRSIKVSNTTMHFDATLPTPVENKAIIFNEEGNGLTTSEYVIDEIIPLAQEEVKKAKAWATSDEEVMPGLQSAKTYASRAGVSEAHAATWAMGVDSAVQALGGEHSARVYAENCEASEDHARIWAEGTDEEAATIGGTKSSRGWAETCDEKLEACIDEVAKAEHQVELAEDQVDLARDQVALAGNEVDKAEIWSEGTDAEVSSLGGEHSAKNWSVVTGNVGKIWSEGTDEEVQALGGIHSSKGWAEQSAQGQIQADMAQTDNTQKDYILNKSIQNLDDVTVDDIQDGDILGYNASTQQFENKGWIGNLDDLLEPVHTINLVGAANMLEYLKEDKANKNVANGYAGLNEYGKIPQSRLENGYLRCTINDGPVKENQSDLLCIPDNEVGSRIEVPGSCGQITFSTPKVLKSISAGYGGYSQPFVANLITNGYCECKAWVTYEDGTTAYYINYANGGGGNFSGIGSINLDTSKRVVSVSYYTRADASVNIPLGAYMNYSSASIYTSSYVEIVDTTHNEPKEIYFNCSNEKPLIYTNGLGKTFTKVGLQKIDISELNLTDGLYRLELPTEGDVAQVVSFPAIYRQKGEPTSPAEGSLWIKIGSNVQALIYTDDEWVTYDKVLGGAFWVTDGYITKYVQPIYHIDYIRNSILDMFESADAKYRYTVYANGYCEQEGESSGNYNVITLAKEYRDMHYALVSTAMNDSTTLASSWHIGYFCSVKVSTSQIKVGTNGCWKTSGLLAEGEF